MTRTKTVSDERVLEAARRVFLRKGVHAPVADVAKELGVSVATLFFRAKTKNELLYRALQPPPPEALEILKRGVDSARDVRSQLLDALLSLCRFFPEVMPSAFLLATAGLLGRNEGELDPPWILREALTRWLRQAKVRGLKIKSPRAASELLIGTLESRYMLAYTHRLRYSPAQDRAFVLKLLRELL